LESVITKVLLLSLDGTAVALHDEKWPNTKCIKRLKHFIVAGEFDTGFWQILQEMFLFAVFKDHLSSAM
jgi:hypothetical protein